MRSPQPNEDPRAPEPAGVAGAVDRFRSGEDREASFRLLFDTFFPAIRRFFQRKGLKPDDCLDLTQETFVRIYEGLDGFRGEARLETWMYRIAMTTYLKSLRRSRTAKRSGDEVSTDVDETGDRLPPTSAGQLDRVLGQERTSAVAQAVQELPEQMRRALTLRVCQELKYREIAVAMQLSIDTVKVHLFQARKRLRRRLGEEFGSEFEW